MLWLVTFFIITVISLGLTIRSMRHYEEPIDHLISKSPYLVRNTGVFNDQVLHRIYDFASDQNILISIERLFRGNEQALIIFGPADLAELFPELELLELEDYLIKGPPQPRRASLNQVLGFEIPLTASMGFIRASFLHSIQLLDSEQFYWQLVIKSVPISEKSKNEIDLNPHFNATVRALVVAEDAQKRVDLAKKILPGLQYDFGIKEHLKPQNTPSVFTEYITRQLSIDQKEDFYINSQEVLALIDLE